MDQATKEKLKAAGLEGVITAFEALQITATKTAEDLALANKTIAEKDVLIEQKNTDLIGVRRENTKLKELTAEEKAKMSEFEIKHHEALLASQQETDKLKKDIADRDAKEVGARRERIFAKYAGKDPELKKKLEDAFTKIVDHDKAQTEEEIAAIAGSAYNMLGIPGGDPVREAMNGGGGDGEGSADNFAATDAGKSLAGAMGLPTEAPKV